MRKKIGECLVQAGLITEADLQTALVEHKRSGERLGSVLVRMNLATERQIAKALAYQLGFSYVNLAENPPDPSAVVLIPKDVALKRTCIAIAVEKNLLTVAMSDPLLFTLVQDLEFQTGYRIKQVVATRAEIVESIGGSDARALVVRDATAQALADVRRIKSILKKPTKAVISHAVLPESWEPLSPAARDFRAATHMRNLTFGAVAESQLVFEEAAAPEGGA